jgi:polysaccharide export outer membrane protein
MSQTLHYRWYRLTAFSLAGLYSTASTLSSAALVWMLNSGVLTEKAVAQLPVLPAPPANLDNFDQAPVFGSGETFDPLSAPPPLGYPDNAVVSPPAQFSRYRLGPGDAISVTVPRFPDLNFQAALNVEGNVVAPLLGTVSLQGLTLEEVQERLRFGFNRFVIDPEVFVGLAGQRAAQVTVTGEVFKPGYYALAPGSQLTAALLTAGGSTTMADLRSILVRRSLVDGSTIEQRVDLFTPLLNGGSLPELRLQDGDAVVIPKIDAATVQTYDRTLVSRSSVAQQQITIRVLSYANENIGTVVLPNGSTFLDVLTAIGPNPRNANLKDIALIRFDAEQGKAITQKLDGRRVLMGDVSQNVPLQNNDVVVVGRSLVSRITYALSVFTQPFRDILGFLLFFRELEEGATNIFSPSIDDIDD